ncbi:MAG TPA: holo-ACP synthase [Phycisphaerales bacterium]|jgi:holo-[acyl-carrier protein] synthase|nr:holo-ACP synthase [Phycisphaerales bacterium]HPO94040.1 holo-ACP synthase [Phycisphaerales bacterium]
MPIVGHGIDIVEVSRIQRMLDEHGEQFLARCFTDGERAVGEGGRRYHEHLAARFAAKEAVMKALGTGLSEGIAWTDCEVVREATGAPRLMLYREALQAAMRLGATRWHVSLSHSDHYAVASVVLERVS